MKHNYDQYMKICEALARKAASRGNSAVGSLLVFNDQIVAQAEEAATIKDDITCHAEMEVIRQARKILGKDMQGAILFTTKEPCVMCSYAIRYHKISKVIFKERAFHLGGLQNTLKLLITDQVPPGWGPAVEWTELNY